MQVSVTFRHMEPTEALKEYAEEKIEKALKKFLKTPFEAHVVLSTERYHHLCDVTVLVSGHTIKGSEKSDDMYTSIDKTGDKIVRQVARYKDKLRNYKPTPQEAELKAPEVLVSLLDQQDEIPEVSANGAEAEVSVSASEPRVLRTESVVARPMTVDQAVMEMDLSGSSILVFTNQENQAISVLYRRQDGKYELIDTRPATGTRRAGG